MKHSQGSRRKFVQLALLGAGASLLSVIFPKTFVHAAGETEALLLSCMDFVSWTKLKGT